MDAINTTPRVLVLLATIPVRRGSCERMLASLAKQSRKPDGVVLVLDGYGEAPAPACPLPVILEKRTAKLSGAGGRWAVTHELPTDDIVICLDDDVVLLEAPRLIENLAATVALGGAAAAMGRRVSGKFAPPGSHSFGQLIYAAGCGLAGRAGDLAGATEFAVAIRDLGGPDLFGVGGDDDALVSAFLWKRGIKITHAATGNIYAAMGTRTTSQTAARAARGEPSDAQKRSLAKLTGWPWTTRPSSPQQGRIS